MRTLVIVGCLGLLASGCAKGKDSDADGKEPAGIDADDDGYFDDEDCDDNDPDVHPNATEVCDDIDNNCDNRADEPDNNLTTLAFWRDEDGDGFGDPSWVIKACVQPVGYADNDDDCDDADAGVNPDDGGC